MNSTTATPLSEDQKWSILQQRILSAAPLFFYGVKTTGVYCRPGCSSRLPRRENVIFFDHTGAAQTAGFRACKKCQPDDWGTDQVQESKHVAAVLSACRMIQQAEKPPALDSIANAVGYSSAYFHRLFKRIVGVTPRAFAAGLRTDRVQASLQNGATVTETVYSAGYGASSRFYEEAPGVLGMAPSDYRNGARGQTIRMAISPTYLGYVLVAATENGICAIELGDAPGQLEDSLRERFSQAHFVEVDAKFQKWVDEVVAFLEAPRRELSLPLDIQGTAFQRRVWEALRTIPVGTTTTYSQVAEQIGQPKAARAVAGACAANTLAAAIPCHRVIRQDGGLSDYRWGVERKKKLLERETTVARPSES